MQKDIFTEKGINEQKNQKNLKKICIFPPFLAKRVGLFDKKGTMYYYKARVMIYDKEGNFVAQTALKQCKYANRLWTK